MKNKIVLFIGALVIWTLLTLPFDWQHFLTGIVVATFISLLTSDLFINRSHLMFNFTRMFWFLYYIPVFVWECFKANVQVAFLVGHPDTPINPGIVKVKTKLNSSTGLTFLANSITLTPGTMCVDVDQQNGYLYIHWINVTDTDVEKATAKIVTTFETILLKIFD